jgi:outer membrane protein assembly factor BamB
MKTAIALLLLCFAACPPAAASEDWPQYKFDSRHSGNVPHREVVTPLGLVGAVGLTDAVFTAPVVDDGRVYVVDGAGVAFCFDAATLELLWKVQTPGGRANCNNVSSPALAGDWLHFGTMAGRYYVLKKSDGSIVKEISCGEPIFSTPVVSGDRVYFATLGSRVFALTPEGNLQWEWDFVKERLGFEHDRWSGEAWCRHKGARVTWRDQFCCSRNIALCGKTLVIPAGGAIVWLEDGGDRALFKQIYAPKESPSTLGLSIDAKDVVYRQWYRRDNCGSVEMLRLVGGKVQVAHVSGTATSYKGAESMSFSSVSVRDGVVYRCRPEVGAGFCRHGADAPTVVLDSALSVTAPILLSKNAIVGGLDGRLSVVPLSGKGKAWSFATAFGKAITAPAAVCDGRVYFGCEDGYLYVLGLEGKAPLPTKDLELWHIRSPLTGKRTAPEFDWHTNFGNMANTNVSDQGLKPPFRIRWVRPFCGTIKHFSVCGGGRMYTHTAEGQIFAVEQETGRLLWRTAFPGVHISYTAPLYLKGRLYVPQAGLDSSFLRCLDASTGRVLWEAPFTGSPSWNRQQPPVLCDGLVFYMFGSGRYSPEKWLFEHQSTFGFPEDHKPLLRAWDAATGREVWTRDFSEYGAGGDDAGICLLDGTLYYSCYFGSREPPGITTALEPATGRVLWTNERHAVHSGCAVSGKDGRLYLGGYAPVDGKLNRIWCLDAEKGSLLWQSEPVERAIHVVTVRDNTLFTHAQYRKSYLLSRESGKILKTMEKGYRCTRFTVSEPYLLGANLDMYDLSDGFSLVSTGPAVDVLLCVGATVSNGRVFFTTNGGGLQVSLCYGDEAAAPGKRRPLFE